MHPKRPHSVNRNEYSIFRALPMATKDNASYWVNNQTFAEKLKVKIEEAE